MVSTEGSPRNSSASVAFRLEYLSNIPVAAVRNNIISYLGEYRFKIEEYHYELLYSQDNSGVFALRDSDQGESMIVKGRRAIQDKVQKGEGVTKVNADLLGMKKLEQELAVAKNGETILWVSPADHEEGYTYGFIYVGRVEQEVGNSIKKLHMIAIRLNNNQEISTYNRALSLLTNQAVNLATPNECVATPFHISREIDSSEVGFVLKSLFDFQISKSNQKMFAEVMSALAVPIEKFIDLVTSGKNGLELQKAFHALENYALKLKEKYECNGSISGEFNFTIKRRFVNPFDVFVGYYGNSVPPIAMGSCGATGRQSADVFGFDSIFLTEGLRFGVREDQYGSLDFECPQCGKTNTRPTGELIPNCQHCGADVSC